MVAGVRPSRDDGKFDPVAALMRRQGLRKVPQIVLAADQGLPYEAVAHQQIARPAHGAWREVKRADDIQLVVVETFGVETERGSRGTTAEEHHGTAAPHEGGSGF